MRKLTEEQNELAVCPFCNSEIFKVTEVEDHRLVFSITKDGEKITKHEDKLTKIEWFWLRCSQCEKKLRRGQIIKEEEMSDGVETN